jgi:drug/metabolite transporter (DMT)-like permease
MTQVKCTSIRAPVRPPPSTIEFKPAVRQRDIAAYTLLAVVWGLSFMVLVRVVAAFGWAGAVSFRALTAGVALLLLAPLIRRRLDFSIGWGPLAISGALTVCLQLAGIAFAAPRIGTAMTAIIVSAIPLFSMVVGRIAGLERLTPRSIIGLVAGFFGIVLLVGFPAEPMTPSFLLGCAVSILGSFAAACGSLYASTKLRAVDPWVVTIGSFISGGIMTLPLLLLVPVPTVPGLADYGWLLVLGVVTSALMYVLFFTLLGAIGPTRAISVEFAVTVVAVLAGTLLLGERLSPMQMAGAAVIVTGCALVLGLWPERARKTA